MNNIQEWGAIIALITNIIVLITTIVQVCKLKKELQDVKIVVNNTSDLQHSLRKPLEGIWEVRGNYTKYHDVAATHNCTGYAFFYWNETNKRYDVYYTYSVRKEQESTDLVTAICNGIALSDENGKIDKKLVIQLTINNRSSIDGVNYCSKNFEFVTNKINKKEERINRLEFAFKNVKTEGVICFIR